jgi:hypothetical protein
MNLHMSGWRIRTTKKIIALAIFAAVGFLPASKAAAQAAQRSNYLNVPIGGAISCRVDGVTYPVDGLGRIWAIGNGGHWIITGHIVPGSYGDTAVRVDGTQSRAVCE